MASVRARVSVASIGRVRPPLTVLLLDQQARSHGKNALRGRGRRAVENSGRATWQHLLQHRQRGADHRHAARDAHADLPSGRRALFGVAHLLRNLLALAGAAEGLYAHHGGGALTDAWSAMAVVGALAASKGGGLETRRLVQAGAEQHEEGHLTGRGPHPPT